MDMTKEALMLAAVVTALHSAAMIDWGEAEGETPKAVRADRVDGAMYAVLQALQWAHFSGGLEECNEMGCELSEMIDPGDPTRLRGSKAVDWAYKNLLPKLDDLCLKYGFSIARYGQVGGNLRVRVY